MSTELLSHDAAVEEIRKAEKAAYDEKMKKMKAKSDDSDADDDDEDEEGDEGDEKDEKSSKSDVSADDLLKSLDILTGTTAMFAGAPVTRQGELASKLAAGDKLSKAEASELASILAHGEGDADFEKSSRESLLEDPGIADAIEISEFLESFVTKSGHLMDSQREILNKSIQEQRQVNFALAKALQAQGKVLAEQTTLVKSMAKSLGAYEDAPVAPKGKTRVSKVGRPFGDAGGGAGEAIVKGQGGGGEVDLTPAGLMNDLEAMIMKSEDGIMEGNDLNFALIKCESSGVVDRTTLNQIQTFRAAASARA